MSARKAIRSAAPRAASSRPVPGDVADQDVHDPVGRLHDVVEVSAQQRVLAARPVAGDDVDARVVEQQRRGQQAAFQQRVLAGPQLARVQVGGDELGALALDRVQQRAPQHFGFDAPLDQVVLRARRDRGSPEVLVVQPGQHDDRDGGVAFGDAVERVDPVGVGQVQVQQHAIGARRCASSRSAWAIDCAHTTRMSATASAIRSSTSTASARSSSTSSNDNDRRVAAGVTGARTGINSRSSVDAQGKPRSALDTPWPR